MEIKIKLLERGGARGRMPTRGTEEAAGADLHAFLPEGPLTLMPGQRYAVPTGAAVELRPGTCAFVMARSGLALREGITMANGVGLIDSDYRGELKVALVNTGDRPFEITDGMRIAQLVIMRYERADFVETAGELSQSARGEGGFGSTGVGPEEPRK